MEAGHDRAMKKLPAGVNTFFLTVSGHTDKPTFLARPLFPSGDNTAATPKHFPDGLFPQLQRSSGKCNVAFGNSGATSKCVDQRWDRLKCKH